MTAKPQDNVAPMKIYLSPFLAWDSIGGDRNRNRWLVIIALVITFGLGGYMRSVEVPKVDRAQAEKVPERLARLVLEKKLEPPPPPPPKEEKPEEEKPEEPKPEEPKPEKPTDAQVEKAREKAQKAMAEAKAELSAMQDMASAFDMGGNQTLTKGAGTAGSGAGLSRDMLSSRSGKGSGGASFGAVSSGGGGAGLAGGGKLAGAQVAAIQSNITEGPTGAVRKNASGKLERTQEEIRRIMDRNNGALQAIYQRALRSNPTLKGQVVLRLVIAADGSVTTADIVSSELGDPDTEKKLTTRIKAINFGAIEGVMVWDDKYTLNFFPS